MTAELATVTGDERAEALPTFLNTRRPAIVRINNAALDEARDGSIVLRGRVASDTLRFLKFDDEYQRPLKDRADIRRALQAQKILPDIDIAVRGQDVSWDGPDCLIASPCYVVDGRQRVGNAIALLDADQNLDIRLGAIVQFASDVSLEAERFNDLNQNTKRISANLHLRNLRNSYTAILTIYGLSYNDRDFQLRGLVAWGQEKVRGQLFHAATICRVVYRLHYDPARGVAITSTESLARGLQKAADAVTLAAFRQNASTFFDVLAEAWPVREIVYSRAAPHIKSSFLAALAIVFNRHDDFWNGPLLRVDASLRRKLAGFPITDPYVATLAGSGGRAAEHLADLIVKHLNSGKRDEYRLRSRYEKK